MPYTNLNIRYLIIPLNLNTPKGEWGKGEEEYKSCKLYSDISWTEERGWPPWQILHLRHVLLGVLTHPFQSNNLRLLQCKVIFVAWEMTQTATTHVVILQTWSSMPWRTSNIRNIKALERHATLVNMYHRCKKSLPCCCCVNIPVWTTTSWLQNKIKLYLFVLTYQNWFSNQPS